MTTRTIQSIITAALLATLTLALIPATNTHAAPQPSIVPVSWELDFAFKTPRIIAVTIPGDTQPSYFYYLPYTVTNRTGEDRLFIPEFTILGNNGTLQTAGQGVHPVVFGAVRDEQQNELLESPLEVIGTLLQGEDNARDSVAIWPVTAADVDQMHVFVKGISGETAAVIDPLTEKKVILRRCLQLNFQTPGDASHRFVKPIRFLSQSWVLR